MDDDVREFGTALGRAALAQSWATVRSEEQVEELDFDIFCEVWAAVVETTEGLRVGYWSQGAY